MDTENDLSRTIIDNLPMGMHLYALSEQGELVLLQANQTADKLLNLEHQKHLGQALESLFPSFISSEAHNKIKQIAHSGGAWKNIGNYLTAPSSSCVFETHSYQVAPNQVVSFFSDVTEKQKTISENQRYKTLFDHAPFEIHMWDIVRNDDNSIKNWSLADANKKTLKAWNKNREDIVGKTTDEIFPGANATEIFRPIVERIFEENKPFSWEEEFPATNQTLYMSSFPSDDSFISTGIDITSTKNNEKQLSDALLRLKVSVKAGKVGIWDWDIKEDNLIWDERMFEIYGVIDDKDKNSVSLWENALHNEDKALAQKAIEQALSGEKDYDIEFRISRPDDSVRFIKADAIVLRDENNAPIRMIGTNLDITNEKTLQEQLIHREKMDAIGQLAGGLAHDFNNHLVSILGYAQLLEQKVTDGNIKRFASKIAESAKRSSKLTRQMLTFSKQRNLVKEDVDVHSEIEEAIDFLSHSVDRRISIKTDFQAEQHIVSIDTSQIQNAFLNLFINACAAMPEGGTLSVKTSNCEAPIELSKSIDAAHSKRACIKIDISDTGTGIEPQYLDKIFDPFFTTKPAGTGMGLASVLATLEQHDGTIEVHSEVDNGTDFSVYLPLNMTSVQSSESEQSPLHQGSKKASDSTILVVDDDESIRHFLDEVLTLEGYTVIEADTGVEAVNLYQHDYVDIDLVILDLVMPIMSGKETYIALKKINPDVHVIVSSGFDSDSALNEPALKDIDAFVEKPYTVSQLLTVVENVLK